MTQRNRRGVLSAVGGGVVITVAANKVGMHVCITLNDKSELKYVDGFNFGCDVKMEELRAVGMSPTDFAELFTASEVRITLPSRVVSRIKEKHPEEGERKRARGGPLSFTNTDAILPGVTTPVFPGYEVHDEWMQFTL